jgi:hypothetical protein
MWFVVALLICLLSVFVSGAEAWGAGDTVALILGMSTGPRHNLRLL